MPGLEHRYHVHRVDGRDAPGQKHHGCRHFVLDMRHDPHALPALLAYAKSCEAEYPDLARDLQEWARYDKGPSSPASRREETCHYGIPAPKCGCPPCERRFNDTPRRPETGEGA